MSSKLVSICIPAYSNPTGLRRALESISTQAYRNFEVIITDDTPDCSVGVVADEFAHIFSVRYFHNTLRLGSPENFNKAISLARGDYIKILCHDDWFFDGNSLSEFVSMLDNQNDADLGFCLSRNVHLSDGDATTRPLPRGFLRHLQNDYRVIFPRNFIGSPSATIFRRRNKIYFDPHLKWVVDILCYADILRENKSVAFVNKPLINIGVGNPGQMTNMVRNDKSVELFEWFYVYRKIYSTLVLRPSIIFIFFRLMKKYNVRSTSEIPDFNLLPAGLMRLIKILIWLPDVFSIAKSHG